MMKITRYKIKVGIEEFYVEPTDVPKITQAMQTNEMVKLARGIFRGQAILAIIEEDVFIDDSPSIPPTPQEIHQRALIDARRNCTKCMASGYLVTKKENGETVAKVCDCQKIKFIGPEIEPEKPPTPFDGLKKEMDGLHKNMKI